MRWSIPATLNLAISGLVLALALALLYAGAHTRGLAFGACALGFAALGQTLFALIHEAEHDKLHPNRRVNDALGTVFSAFFPGSFSVLRAAHLAHHRRNRSDAELIDFYRPGESRLVKTLKYYALISGAIWIGAPLTSLALCLVPGRRFRGKPKEERSTDLATYLAFLDGVSFWRIRLEVLAAAAQWGLMAWALGLRAGPLAWQYAAFAFFWASQQYVYHVRTPVHRVEGTFDLRLPGWLRWAWLNLNYHLTHHRDVTVPWLYLPAAAARPPWRPYLRTWLDSWRPPRPIERAWPQRFLARGPLPEPSPPEFREPA